MRSPASGAAPLRSCLGELLPLAVGLLFVGIGTVVVVLLPFLDAMRLAVPTAAGIAGYLVAVAVMLTRSRREQRTAAAAANSNATGASQGTHRET